MIDERYASADGFEPTSIVTMRGDRPPRPRRSAIEASISIRSVAARSEPFNICVIHPPFDVTLLNSFETSPSKISVLAFGFVLLLLVPSLKRERNLETASRFFRSFVAEKYTSARP